MFSDPQAHTIRGLNFATVISGYYSAVAEAKEKLGMSASLIMCFLREISEDSAMNTLTEALPHKDKIVGGGLDRDNPPNKFAGVFAKARKEKFRLTMHCDVHQKNSIEHIRQGVESIGVDRVDHGTNVVENTRLVKLVREKKIGLTCCPVSNSVMTKDFKGSEIISFFRDGVKVTINSDDPAYFRAYLNGNLELLVEKKSLSKWDLVHLQRNAFEISWIPHEEESRFIDMLEDYAPTHW